MLPTGQPGLEVLPLLAAEGLVLPARVVDCHARFFCWERIGSMTVDLISMGGGLFLFVPWLYMGGG